MGYIPLTFIHARQMTLIPFLLFQTSAQAKDLDNKLGVGLDTWLSDTPALSARYALKMPGVREAQIEGILGFSTDPSSPNQFSIGVRALYSVVVEDHMNLNLTGGLAGLNKDGTGALRIQPGLEAQFFLWGLDNLSFNAGVGANFDIGAGNTQTKITGSVLAGFHYWL